jgi:hypothetical protein
MAVGDPPTMGSKFGLEYFFVPIVAAKYGLDGVEEDGVYRGFE